MKFGSWRLFNSSRLFKSYPTAAIFVRPFRLTVKVLVHCALTSHQGGFTVQTASFAIASKINITFISDWWNLKQWFHEIKREFNAFVSQKTLLFFQTQDLLYSMNREWYISKSRKNDGLLFKKYVPHRQKFSHMLLSNDLFNQNFQKFKLQCTFHNSPYCMHNAVFKEMEFFHFRLLTSLNGTYNNE